MCDKSVNTYCSTMYLFLVGCCKTQEMWNKVVNTYYSSIQFVPDYYKAQDMFDKAANKCFLLFIYIPVRYTAQEMCGELFLKMLLC